MIIIKVKKFNPKGVLNGHSKIIQPTLYYPN